MSWFRKMSPARLIALGFLSSHINRVSALDAAVLGKIRAASQLFKMHFSLPPVRFA